MSSWHSYTSIYNLGHRAVADLLDGDVIVEEKIDGSQFSFGVFPDPQFEDYNGQLGPVPVLSELRVRSKGAVMLVDAPERMFTQAVETAKRLAPQLRLGWTYRGEYLQKPEHNALAYDRIPHGHVILFDINPDEEGYLSYDDKAAEAARLGLEIVPRLFQGRLTLDIARTLLDTTTSILGGQPIEGIVVKQVNVTRFGADKKALMAKFVSERFKEVHKTNWKLGNPTRGDVVEQLIGSYRTAARWQKSVQHMRERGELEGSPRDIGKLMAEVPDDLKKEEAGAIKDALFGWAWPQIRRGVTHGLPEWYKEELLKRQFE